MSKTLIDKALATIAEHESAYAVSDTRQPAPALPLAEMLVLAIYQHELRRRRRVAPGDARPDQLIKTARDAKIAEHEIQAALDTAAAASGSS